MFMVWRSQGWIILAEALRGHGGRAFTYFMENAPSANMSYKYQNHAVIFFMKYLL